MRRLLVLFLACSIGAVASADILFDQIGPDVTATELGFAHASQVISDFAGYEIAVVDDFTLDGAYDLTSVEAVFGFWNGAEAVGYTGADSWNVEIYSSAAAAEASLTGDVASMTGLQPSMATEPFGGDDLDNRVLLEFDVSASLAAGTYWIGVMPVGSFSFWGQAGVINSTIGDNNMGQATRAAPLGSPIRPPIRRPMPATASTACRSRRASHCWPWRACCFVVAKTTSRSPSGQ